MPYGLCLTSSTTLRVPRKCRQRCRAKSSHVTDGPQEAPKGISFTPPHPVTIYRWMGGDGIWGCDGQVCRYVLEFSRPHMDVSQLQNYVQRCGSHFKPMDQRGNQFVPIGQNKQAPHNYSFLRDCPFNIEPLQVVSVRRP